VDLHLRDATFHDGTPLTAEDVVFTYDLYANTEGYPWMGDYTYYFESVEAPDPKTVVITLSEAIPNLDSQLVFLYVLPKHIWENEDPVEFENEEMIGSGPFKMVEYSQNEFVHLAANPDHPQAPKIDEVIFQTFESNDALVQAIKTGQVDMITEFPATAIESLRAAENVEVVTGAPFAPTVTDIIFNQCAPENCPEGDGICSGHPSLQDRNVRLALSHATNKQQIIDVIYLGLASPGTTLIPDGLGVWYNESIQDYEFDVEPGQPNPGRRRLSRYEQRRGARDAGRYEPVGLPPELAERLDRWTAPGRTAGRDVGAGRRGHRTPGHGPGCADRSLLPGLRLRRHAVGLGLRPGPEPAPVRHDHRRNPDRQQRNRLLQSRNLMSSITPRLPKWTSKPAKNGLADAANRLRRCGLHHPLL
jgi:hypothetical protein